MEKSNIIIDQDYAALIQSIKQTVKSSQLKAHRAVNVELIKMYWLIGKELSERKKLEQWGAKFLEQVSKDLKLEFPGLKGFSLRNLKYMCQFALTYPVGLIGQQAVAQLPWGHIVLLIQKVKGGSLRDWYVDQAIEQGWSRHVLNQMIKSELHLRQKDKLKITNFQKTLPKEQSDLAYEILKDPYCFDFVNVNASSHERDIENALVNNIRDFLLHLGKGYAFVGNQYHLKIGETDFYIDCLFYNFKMRCFVVIELKKGVFKAEYTGQLNLYLTGIDRLVKLPEDNPTIGIVLCESKDEIVAQYAVDGMTKPMGISEYELGKALTQHLKMRQDQQLLSEKAVDPVI